MSFSLFSSRRSERPPVRVWVLMSVASAALACAPDGPAAPATRASVLSADVVDATTAAKPASSGITIAVVVEPQSALAVPFTTTGKRVRDFSLDDNADPVLPNAITFDRLKPGTYTVQAQPVAGLTLAKVACTASGGAVAPTTDLTSGMATISLDAGESVRCTFTHIKQWQNGDVISYGQVGWSGLTPAGQQLTAHFFDLYPSGVFRVGMLSGGYTITFDSSLGVFNYLPANGIPGPLTSSVNDPTTTPSGVFGGEVTTLQLNVDLSDAGYLLGTTSIRFGDLTLCADTRVPALNASSVRSIAALVNNLLGGATTSYDFSALSLVLDDLNLAFNAGTPTSWAQAHLVAGPCP